MIHSISIHTVYKHPNQLEFNKQAWCIQEQYWRYLGQYDMGQYKKIVVEVNDEIQTIGEEEIIKESTTDVVIICSYLNIISYLSKTKSERKAILIELLHKSMLSLTQYLGYEKGPLINSYNRCIENNLNYIFKIKDKNFKSPTKAFFGCVICNWDIDLFSVTILISSATNNNIIKQRVFDFQPHLAEFIYYTFCKWESGTAFSLIAKDGRKWSVDILSVV